MSRLALLQTIGITAPEWFPAAEHGATNSLLAKHAREPGEFRAFASAWNAVAARARRIEEIADELITRWEQIPNAPPEDRYREDCLVFEFASYSVSAIECAAFAIGCILSQLDRQAFPMAASDHLRNVSLDKLVKRARSHARFSSVAIVAQTCNETMDELRRLRDFLVHRGQLPRQAHLSNSVLESSAAPANAKDHASTWDFTLRLTSETVQRWRQSFLISVQTLVEVAYSISKELKEQAS